MNDYLRYQQFGDAAVDLSKLLINQVTALYHNPRCDCIAVFSLPACRQLFVSNSAQTFKYNLTVRMIAQATFTGGDPYANPPVRNAALLCCLSADSVAFAQHLGGVGEINHIALLTTFNNWFASANGNTLPAGDNGAVRSSFRGATHQYCLSQLLSGYNFAGSVVGYAGIRSMCQLGGSASITQATGPNPVTTASTTAHEMGHNLGSQHDQVVRAFAFVAVCHDGWLT